MNYDKMHLINKIFNNETIRMIWDKDDEKYYISVVDIVGVLVDNKYQDSRNYWKVLKHRLKKEGNQTVTNCNQLKLKASDGKYRLTDVWQESGVNKTSEYALLTNEIYKTWSGMTSREYKEYKGLRKETLRDNMDNIELILTDLGEEATKRLVIKNKPSGLKENIELAKKGGNIAKITKEELEKNFGEKIISKSNNLDSKYLDKK